MSKKKKRKSPSEPLSERPTALFKFQSINTILKDINNKIEDLDLLIKSNVETLSDSIEDGDIQENEVEKIQKNMKDTIQQTKDELDSLKQGINGKSWGNLRSLKTIIYDVDKVKDFDITDSTKYICSAILSEIRKLECLIEIGIRNNNSTLPKDTLGRIDNIEEKICNILSTAARPLSEEPEDNTSSTNHTSVSDASSTSTPDQYTDFCGIPDLLGDTDPS